EDLVEELVGDIRDEYDRDESHALRLVQQAVHLDVAADQPELPEGPYETVAGYIVARPGHAPEVGEACAIDGHVLAVVAVDGRRVSRVRVSRRPELTLDAGAETG